MCEKNVHPTQWQIILLFFITKEIYLYTILKCDYFALIFPPFAAKDMKM